MTNWFFFLSTLAVVSCRPQINPQETPSVEFILSSNGLRYPRWPSHPSSAFSQSPKSPEINLQTDKFAVVPTEEILKNSTGSLAPYKAHPLFYFLKNRNTINTDKIISFRNDNSKEEVTTLILKPVAKSVAGIDGQAISNPLSRAILRQGMNVDILFEPEAVAVAGPGGVAHAQSDLEITYENF